MREILFRGKRADNGEWIVGMLSKSRPDIKNYDCIVDNGWFENDAGMTAFHKEKIIPETVGQYTGLTDKNGKNGKKIFEGDIVSCIYDGVRKPNYVVVYDIDELGFKATNGRENYGINFQYLPCCEEVEVIGNIHDNPELIQEVSNG